MAENEELRRQLAHLVGDGGEVSVREHLETVIALTEKLSLERDRRYAEINLEKEKAIAIKTEADKTALALAREIQVYKDEKANELRSQIERERGAYITRPELVAAVEKLEAVLQPLVEFAQGQRGSEQGSHQVWGYLIGAAGTLFALAVLAAKLIGH
jgi:hypothetical protein